MKNVERGAKAVGRVYTPTYIVRNILDLSGYYGVSILKKHVIDNSCGNGAFLLEAVKRYCDLSKDRDTLKNELETYIHGIDIDQEETTKCIENLNNIVKEYGLVNVKWDIRCADALTITDCDDKMDFVIGNPPYVRVHNLGKSFETVKSFSFSQSGMTDLYVVFFELGLRMLNASGVLGYITPSSYFNSIAGAYMRKHLVDEGLLDKIVDLRHFQAFKETTYTAITILKKSRDKTPVSYYRFDEENLIPYFVDSLKIADFYISDCFYFSETVNLSFLKKIFYNTGKCQISVKNGYATLCDAVFIYDFEFDSPYIRPVIKASTASHKKMFYPYDEEGVLISEDELKKDEEMYSYLQRNKSKLINRSIDSSEESRWYSFGRSQAINDTYKDKIAINTLLRNSGDWKIEFAPAGTGVYSGLYIVSDHYPAEEIKKALVNEEFLLYISILGKYKSGGYYTFSSKDVKAYLNYKFAYNGGLLNDD